MAQRSTRRRAQVKSSTGPRGGRYTTRNVTRRGPRGGVTRHTDTRNARSGRRVSKKTVYVGSAK